MSDVEAKKPYNKKKKQYNAKYTENNYKRIMLNIRKSYYNETLLPYVQSLGTSTNSFIKDAIDFYIQNHPLNKF